MIRARLLLAVPLALAACTSPAGRGPSLLPRAAERQSFDEPAPPPAALVAPDVALDAKIAALGADRTKASTAFADADRRVAALLTAGARAAPGSDAWLDAQTALSELEGARAMLSGILTDLDQLAIARAGDGQPPYPALDAAHADLAAQVDEASRTVAARKAALPL